MDTQSTVVTIVSACGTIFSTFAVCYDLYWKNKPFFVSKISIINQNGGLDEFSIDKTAKLIKVYLNGTVKIEFKTGHISSYREFYKWEKS